jgi:hypothetical protein
VLAGAACRNLQIHHNLIENSRHAIAGGGYWPSVYIDVFDNVAKRTSNLAFDCHEPCFFWTWSRNKAERVTGGFIIRGQYVTLDDNEIYDSSSEAVLVFAYDGVTEQRGIKVRGTRVHRSHQGIVVDGLNQGGTTADNKKYDVEVSGSRISGIYLTAGSSLLVRHFDGAIVKDNLLTNTPAAAIDVRGLSSGSPSSNLHLSGNTIRASTTRALKAQYVDNVHGDLGVIVDSPDTGAQFDTCNRVNLGPSLIRTVRLNGAEFLTCTNVNLSGWHVTDAYGSTVDCVSFTACTTVGVIGGLFQGGRAAVRTVTTDYVRVASNDVHQCASGTKVNNDASAVNKSVINNL